MKNKWIILIQYGASIEPAYWEEDKPYLFDGEEVATRLMNDDFSDMVDRQKEEVELGCREPDEVDTKNEEWVSPCTVDENGCISIPIDGEIYNPKTFVR